MPKSDDSQRTLNVVVSLYENAEHTRQAAVWMDRMAARFASNVTWEVVHPCGWSDSPAMREAWFDRMRDDAPEWSGR